MAESIKIEKLNSLILRELNIIIKREFTTDLIMSEITLHEVMTTNDCSQSRIYYSFVSKENDLKTLQKKLTKYNKIIRYKLSKKLTLYKTPKLVFIYDETLDNAMKIQNILDNVKTNNGKK